MEKRNNIGAKMHNCMLEKSVLTPAHVKGKQYRMHNYLRVIEAYFI